MLDEEKKAFDYYKECNEKDLDGFKYLGDESKKQTKYMQTLLNLIEKNNLKEIEELKEKNKPQPDCSETIERTEEMVNMRWVNHNYISKDKIKAKIEDKESQINDIKDNLDYDEVMVNEVKRLENEIEVLHSILEKE